ncbi:MAG: hypothetical protein NXI30_05945 [bacterium]|nr:hypothetical protein [bacterium]
MIGLFLGIFVRTLLGRFAGLAIMMILDVDGVPDMSRTAVNVMGT